MSDEHTKCDGEARADASYRAADAHQNEKQSQLAKFELTQDFIKKHGFAVELTPDDAGRIIYGDDKVTIELAPAAQAEGDLPTDLPTNEVPMTFFTSAADTATDTKVKVTAGSMGPIMVPETTLTVADGDRIELSVQFSADGSTITDALVQAAPLPSSNTPTLAYFPLASIAVAGGVTTVTPTAWNYSWAQACGKDGSGNIVANPY